MNDQPSGNSPGSQPRNTLGLVGFLFSLLGVLTCGLVAPVGLLLSLLALLRRPRGFAMAGTVIGLLATLWLGLAGSLLVTGVRGLGSFAERFGDDFQQSLSTIAVVSEASREVTQHRDLEGDWPDETTGQELVGQYQDAYGNTLRYTRVGDMVLIISPGPDHEFATGDDISIDPQTMSVHPGAQDPMELD